MPTAAEPRGPGRPSALTAETRDRIIALVRAGNYLETAAAACGVHRITLYKWLKRGAKEPHGLRRDLVVSVERASGESEARDVALISRAAMDQWQAAAWKLERKNPGRWGQRVRVTVDAELDAALDRLRDQLDAPTYSRVLAALAGRPVAGAPGADATGEG